MLQTPNSPNPFSAPVSSVSEFVLHVRETLEAHVPLCWIGGEVSNLTRAASGHLYFTLKDARAQIRCTMWRNRAQLLPFQLQEGAQIEVRANISIYEARGDLQLSVETIRRAGLGNLYEAFLRLKAQLQGEGLFDPTRKRALPRLPRGVALVTSPAAAALRDVLTTLARRAPALPVVLYPSPVQGDGAGLQIAKAIALANSRAETDHTELLIICRGGGSLEDLWAFNEEPVIRAVAASKLPVICGVGHETDTSLADFAADVRAPTPTAAAEIASAGWFEVRAHLPRLQERLLRALAFKLGHADQRLLQLQQKLVHPRTRLLQSGERLKLLTLRLENAQRRRHQLQQKRLDALHHRLDVGRPRIEPHTLQLEALKQSLQAAMQRHCKTAENRLDLLENGLKLLNPDAILHRGYAIVRDEHGHIVRQADAVANNARLDIQLADTRLRARVEADPTP